MIPDGADPVSVLKRFWKRVVRGGDNNCWEWRGYCGPRGYGRFNPKAGAIPMQAHRFAYWVATGIVPGEVVMHTCDNPPCVNPAHLRNTTQSDNMQDSWNKGRQVGRTRLTREQVKEVLLSSESRVVLAKRLGVTSANIGYIRRGEIWADVYKEVANDKEASRSCASPAQI